MAGVDVEVLLFLMNALNFTTDLVRADNFGIPKGDSWTGIMGQLVTGLSEFSISLLSMTKARAGGSASALSFPCFYVLKKEFMSCYRSPFSAVIEYRALLVKYKTFLGYWVKVAKALVHVTGKF